MKMKKKPTYDTFNRITLHYPQNVLFIRSSQTQRAQRQTDWFNHFVRNDLLGFKNEFKLILTDCLSNFWILASIENSLDTLEIWYIAGYRILYLGVSLVSGNVNKNLMQWIVFITHRRFFSSSLFWYHLRYVMVGQM